jgi:hypothetical protein
MTKGSNHFCVKLLLLVSISLAVLTSGCVIPQGGSGGPGLVIEKFEPSMSNIESNEPMIFHLQVRNKGESKGPLGYGVPAVAELMGIDPMEWRVVPSVYSQPMSLLPPDKEANSEGGLGTVNWDAMSPLISEGQSVPYEAIARVYYLYKSTARKPVWFVTKPELETVIRSGGSLTSEATTYTSGPLSVNILVNNFVAAREWTDNKFQIQITLNNVGTGHIFGRNYPVGVTVRWPDFVQPVQDCPRELTWEGSMYDTMPLGLSQPATGGRFVRVWDTRTTDITCEFTIISPPSSRTKSYFEVDLDYIYYIDASTKVTVKGMEQTI